METSVPPVIIPMWLTGFDKLMPEGRAFPYKYFPRPGAKLSVTFGDPLPAEDITKALGVLGKEKSSSFSSHGRSHQPMTGWMGDQATKELDRTLEGCRDFEEQRTIETMKIRAEVTAIIQQRVESLGRSISGNSLLKYP